MLIKDIKQIFIRNKIILFSILILLNIALKADKKYYEIILGEFGILEITQVLLILSSLSIILYYRKFLGKTFGKLYLNLKILFLSIILFEETSFWTYGLFQFSNDFNNQGELNFHNSKFLLRKFNFNLDLIDNEIHLLTIISLIFVCLISFGSFLPFFKKRNLIFFEKEFVSFGFIYLFNFVISSFVRYLNIENTKFVMFHAEIMELLFYTFIFINLITKIEIISKDKNI